MTIGKVFTKGLLSTDAGIVEPLDAISMLCLYQMVHGVDEFELMFPQELPEKDIGNRILRDMQEFQYFRRRNVSSQEQVLKHLSKRHIHHSIWRNRTWLRSMMPDAYVKGCFLYYPVKKDGTVIVEKVWLYSFKMLFANPKSYVNCIMDVLRIVD